MTDRKKLVKEAKLKAARYCARGEKSKRKVEEKLKGWGLQPLEISEIIAALLSEGFISETRFAEAFVHDKFHFNQWGRVKIKSELRYVHGVEEATITDAFHRIPEEEYRGVMISLIEKKWASIPSEDVHTSKKKVSNYLISKGFEPSIVFELLNEFVRSRI